MLNKIDESKKAFKILRSSLPHNSIFNDDCAYYIGIEFHKSK